MNPCRFCLALLLALCLSIELLGADTPESPYAQWKQGVSATPDFFPLAVWLQAPHNAAKYKALGINLYVGLWDGPTEEQLIQLEKAGMPVICGQNAVGLKSARSKVIVGWMHGDEPDNAQPLPNGKGYGPPITPETIQTDYAKLRATDASRPILLNLGQGVAWDGWHGRGARSNKPEDYPLYVKGGDIVSFDIYPSSHDHKDIAGKLEYVAKGVERLVEWSNDGKIVWCCIETTQISNPGHTPSPQAIRAQVWMALVRGARGIIYFAHTFKPKFIEAGLLAETASMAAVKELNKEISSLAPVLNSPTVKDAVRTQSAPEATIATLAKNHDGAQYLFSVNLSARDTVATFQLPAPAAKVEVLHENRTLDLKDGRFSDTFNAYGVHLYRITRP